MFEGGGLSSDPRRSRVRERDKPTGDERSLSHHRHDVTGVGTFCHPTNGTFVPRGGRLRKSRSDASVLSSKFAHSVSLTSVGLQEKSSDAVGGRAMYKPSCHTRLDHADCFSSNQIMMI